MNDFCKIDDFKICKAENQTVLYMIGHFQCVPGRHDIDIEMNGISYDTHASILPEEHGKGAVQHSFEIEWTMPAEAESLLFILKDEEGNKQEILSYQSEEIAAHTVDTSIVYHIENVNVSEANTGTIIGWAYSLNNKEVTYQVVDQEGNTVRTSLRRILQQRLFDRGVVKREQELCGFILTFEKSEGKTYSLKMSDEQSVVTVSMEQYISQNAVSAGGIVKLLHMINKRNIQRGMIYLKKNGVVGFFKRLSQGVTEEMDYDAWFRRNHITKEELEEQKKHVFAYAPKISILVPTYNTPEDLLHEMIQSVYDQSYTNWQLCIADGSDEDSPARKIIQAYQKKDERITVVYLKENYGISGNTNKALELANGEYTGLFDHDDVLEPDALYEVVKALQETQHDVIYTDEDKLNDDTKRYEDPNFKPDYDPDLLLSHNYITHFFVVRTSIIKGAGGFNSEYDGAQDYDVIFRCIEKAQDVWHIRKSLYHWRMHEGSTALDPESKMYCYVAGQKAIQAHLDRMGIQAKSSMQGKPLFGLYHVGYQVPNAKVSIIIPNKDHSDVLKTCIDSLYQINTYQNIEIIIVENGSTEQATLNYYSALQKEHSNIKIPVWKGKEFNYSAINNYGAEKASGDYYLFLNNDTEMISPDAIAEMLGLCARNDVGIVGAKLLYADNTIQHAGVIVGFAGYAGHVFNDIPNGKDFGYMTRDVLNGDLSAVTAACMMTKADIFHEVGGFDEQFKVACNDIDYCLKVRSKGALVVYNAFALWHHYESKSRGYENGFDKTARFDDEVARWQKKWMDVLLDGDPYYNPNFKIEDGPFILQ